MNELDLISVLIDKSIEAFILGLEVYNKPTIKYRVEGFSFFICNAWELMLKAQIIKLKGEEAIYYKDKPDRTKSLENVIDEIFPDKYGSLRKNLLKIKDLRDTSTHFITDDYEYIYAPLFQACVLNYTSKMQEFHNKDITNAVAQNFLTLSVKIDHLDSDEIRAKYTPKMAERLISEKEKIKDSLLQANSDYAIPVESRLYITKNKNDSDLSVRIDSSSSNSVQILKEVKDTNNLYPLTTKDVCKIVNHKLKSKNILLTKIVHGEERLTAFTTNDLNLFNTFYDIKSNQKYCYHFNIGNRYGYNPKVCDSICECIEKDPQNFVENLKKGIKNR